MKRTSFGFTVIELMIVVTVIGILAAIAYPSYIDYVKKSRRAEAQADLLDMQIKQERYRAYNNTYGSETSLADSGLTIPNDTAYYDYSVSGPTSSAYTVVASPVEGSSQESDCGGSELTLNQSNVKAPAECWQD